MPLVDGRAERRTGSLDTSVRIGSVTLPNPVMTASGTAGHGTELAPYGDLSALGAFVAKSLAAFAWAGNPSPRVHPTAQGMINAVGLQGPGVPAWLADDLPGLVAAGARPVVSIWGRSVADYAAAAEQLAAAPTSDSVLAVEVNLSCPNLEGRRGIFAHDAALSAEVIEAVAVCGKPLWAKLSPNTDRLVDVAEAVVAAGAEAVTLINTVLGMVIDPATRRPALGNGGGGLSGRAIHPVAVRAVFDVHHAIPTLPIIGVGGVTDGWSAAELMIAGASAVQVGTATFADPRAPWHVLEGLIRWSEAEGIRSLSELSHPPG
ncbi:MAG: pyrD [Ilumatobacteraceae bacterium]|nr:pyrD [Ilumatobacteraceae bacterium]